MSKQKRKTKCEKTQSFLNSIAQKDLIYDLFCACRLCGESAGYKMPILQNIIPMEDREVALNIKILECLQIQVQENDSMPPLICELCADKIIHFYDFILMCRQRNEQIRMKLGLPIQVIRNEVKNQSDTILGARECVCLKKEENRIEQGKTKLNKKKNVTVVQQEVKEHLKNAKNKKEKLTGAQRELRDLMASNLIFDNTSNTHRHFREKTQSLERSSTPPQTKLDFRNDSKSDKKEKKKDLSLAPGPAKSILKRQKEVPQKKVQCKKVKIDVPAPSKCMSDSNDISWQICDICQLKFPKGRSFLNHYRIHTRVSAKTKSEKECSSGSTKLPKQEIAHKVDEQILIGTCKNCGKSFEVNTRFRKHQAACKGGKRKIVSSLRKRMKPVQVRIIRCNALLEERDGRYDVSNVRNYYDLDKTCVYPYAMNSLQCSDRMVEINVSETPDSFDLNDKEEFAHWDSDDVSDEEGHLPRQVKSLSTLSLKAIFSNTFMGKVPKKQKKNKSFYDDINIKVNSIINHLDDKSITNSANDDWNDNVSDSILKDGYDSDRISLHDNINDRIKVNKVTENSLGENIKLEMTMGNTEMECGLSKDFHSGSDRTNEKSPNSSKNCLTDGGNVSHLTQDRDNIETGNSNDFTNMCEDILQNKSSDKNINYSLDTLKPSNTKIEFLGIEILHNDNVCSHKIQSDVEILQNAPEIVDSTGAIENTDNLVTNIDNSDTNEKSESRTSENLVQSNEVLSQPEEIVSNNCVNGTERNFSATNACSLSVMMNDDSEVTADANLTTTTQSREDKSKLPSIINDNKENEKIEICDSDVSTHNKEHTSGYVIHDVNPEKDPKVLFDNDNSADEGKVKFIEDSLLNLNETHINQNKYYKSAVKELEQVEEFDSNVNKKDDIYDDLLERLSSNKKSQCTEARREVGNSKNLEENGETIGDSASMAVDGNYGDLIENLTNGEKPDGGIGEIKIETNGVENISDGGVDKDNAKNVNFTLDDLLAEKSMDLDSLADGEFKFDDN